MNHEPQTDILDYYTYPPIGGDDWRYAFETAQVRVLEMHMLTRATLHDMANAESLDAACDLLSAGEYAVPHTHRTFAEMENLLQLRRVELRELFEVLCLDTEIIELLRTCADFANLRLAVRRMLTEKPVGADYSEWGNVGPEMYEQVFGAEEEPTEPVLPDYLHDAADEAFLAYYQNKDIRRIDYTIDKCQARYNLQRARQLDSVFLLSLFRIQIDLTNIRTMLRLKFTESEQRNVFLEGGFLQLERLERALDAGYEATGQVFFVTPYHRLVETGAGYLVSEKSFLKIEQQCDEYFTGFLRTTIQITAGPQPIIAFLRMKEDEIRTVRLILTAKKNELDTKLIMDRIS
jgi:V/A-type H+-transporting ATPase subunit C